MHDGERGGVTARATRTGVSAELSVRGGRVLRGCCPGRHGRPAGNYQVAAPRPVDPSKPPSAYFGVRVGKSYVTHHLMPVYAEPSLLEGLSPGSASGCRADRASTSRSWTRAPR